MFQNPRTVLKHRTHVQLLAAAFLQTKTYYNWMTLICSNYLTGVFAETIHQRPNPVICKQTTGAVQKDHLTSNTITCCTHQTNTWEIYQDMIFLIQNWLTNNQCYTAMNCTKVVCWPFLILPKQYTVHALPKTSNTPCINRDGSVTEESNRKPSESWGETNV